MLTIGLTEDLERFYLFPGKTCRIGARVEFLVNGCRDLVLEGGVRFRMLQKVGEYPERYPERVVVDVQIDEVMTLDVGLGLTLFLHVVGRHLDVVGDVVSGEQFLGFGHDEQFLQGVDRLREEELRHAEPEVVEELVEDIEVLVGHVRVKWMIVAVAEYRVEDGVEKGLRGERPQAVRSVRSPRLRLATDAAVVVMVVVVVVGCSYSG